MRTGDEGKFAAIDIESGTYEIDVDELAACDKLSARIPAAQIWLVRVGSRFLHRFGGPRNGECHDYGCGDGSRRPHPRLLSDRRAFDCMMLSRWPTSSYLPASASSSAVSVPARALADNSRIRSLSVWSKSSARYPERFPAKKWVVLAAGFG